MYILICRKFLYTKVVTKAGFGFINLFIFEKGQLAQECHHY